MRNSNVNIWCFTPMILDLRSGSRRDSRHKLTLLVGQHNIIIKYTFEAVIPHSPASWTKNSKIRAVWCKIFFELFKHHVSSGLYARHNFKGGLHLRMMKPSPPPSMQHTLINLDFLKKDLMSRFCFDRFILAADIIVWQCTRTHTQIMCGAHVHIHYNTCVHVQRLY